MILLFNFGWQAKVCRLTLRIPNYIMYTLLVSVWMDYIFHSLATNILYSEWKNSQGTKRVPTKSDPEHVDQQTSVLFDSNNISWNIFVKKIKKHWTHFKSICYSVVKVPLNWRSSYLREKLRKWCNGGGAHMCALLHKFNLRK